jgi:hypothetical protein
LAEVHINFLGDRTNYKALHSICYQLVNKTRNLLFAIQLSTIYIIYGDRTIIGFVGFVANLLTDGATVSVRKGASGKELLFVVKLPFLLRMPKNCFIYLFRNFGENL